MKVTHRCKRLLSLLLSLTMLLSLVLPASAKQESESLSFHRVDASAVSTDLRTNAADETVEEPDYADTDVVRVSIVLDGKPTIQAGYATKNIAANAAATAYRDELRAAQKNVVAAIERVTREKLDVVWNLTLAANIISANLAYGKIETVRQIPGVKDVFVETRYEPCVVNADEANDPNMATSSSQIGSSNAWAAGYTGAGTRIAVVDTGIDTDHKSFSADAYQYSLAYQAGLHQMTVDEFVASIDLLDATEIADKLNQLNISGVRADQLYVNSKIPFAYNYIDKNLEITHDNDTAGEHGSHVEGIAAANAFVPNGDGTYSDALDAVKVRGVAADAQIITMKVFGKGGGAYDSDYMAAIEDAIVLGCDSINLSLGSGNPGFARDNTYQEILDGFADTDTVVVMSAGNSGHWAENGNHGTGYLYGDDISFATSGSPGSYTNTLSVASVDNTGFTGNYFSVADHAVFYTDSSSSGYSNAPFTTLSGDYDYILFDGFGTAEDFAKAGEALQGKIAFVSRGTTSFYQKHDAAAEAGASACVVYNNQPGTINMDLSSSRATIPCVSITQADGAMIRAASTPVYAEDGTTVLYYTGKMNVTDKIGSVIYDNDYYTMSDFSSWGALGTLGIKPEITAPGGSIYSVNGAIAGGEAYEVMSGTSMAAPQTTGMAALMVQYIEENKLDEKTGLSARQLAQSLLMSTAVPVVENFGEDYGDGYYPVLRQGSGLANIGNAVAADTYLMMKEDATKSYADGKIKAELGDDPEKKGEYSFSFTVNNFSDKAQSYTMRSDFFTQDIFEEAGYTWLDTWTATLPVNVTYTVDGKEFKPESKVVCDLDLDGDTDADDAQIILNYAVGEAESIDAIADVNGDGAINTYDAYLILSGIESGLFTVAAGKSADVTVKVVLPEAVKKVLDSKYVNGAYVEGYVYVTPTVSSEGVVAPEHSIPVLAFYGNWSEASMYDKGSFTTRLYGDTTPTYTGVTQTNYFTFSTDGGKTSYYQVGNPYGFEAKYPAERVSISGEATLSRFQVSLIRNAAAIAAFIMDSNGKVLDMTTVTNNFPSAYYYVNGGSWQNTAGGLTWNKKLGTLGLKQGDQVTVGMVAVPEYYETNGDITKEELIQLIESGKLGKGAFQATTMKVDSNAPELLGIYKDLVTGDLLITAKDDQYMAINAVMNSSGSKMLAKALPAQTEPGQTVTTRISLDGVTLGKKALIMVGDYAGNEAVYEIENNSDEDATVGKMFGFTMLHYSGLTTDTRGSDANRWLSIDPEKVYYYNESDFGGTEDQSAVDLQVCAGEYVDGYVFTATMDGELYVAPHGEWESVQEICNYFQYTDEKEIEDMAFNYQDKKLYALDKANTIYTVDMLTGEMVKVAEITIVNPRSSSSSYRKLTMLAIDDNGNFYSTNYGGTGYTFLYRYTLNDIVDGKITDLTPVVNDKNNKIGFYGSYGSMAWDHDKDVLYMIGSSSVLSSSASICITVDTETGIGTRTNTTEANGNDVARYGSRVQNTISGLYIVPSKASILPPSTNASAITLDRTSVDGLIGTEFTLMEKVAPWNLTDKSVTWISSDESVATVDASGKVTLVGAGEATITATTVAQPNLTATCTVRSSKLDTVKLSALIYDVDENTYWADFTTDAPASWKAASGKTGSYIGGGLKGDMIYAHDGSNMYKIDADLFETVQNCGAIASSWQWSDAAAAPAIDGLFDGVMGVCNEGLYLEMVYPEEGKLSYWDLSWDLDSPMATIAYAGSGTYDYVYYAKEYNDCPANFYYMMTESGELWMIVVLTFDNGDSYVIDSGYLGTVPGITLTGVSGITSGQYASMVYDQATGYLLLSSYQEGETNTLYAINPDTQLATNLGSFGEKVWPVVSMYQYERATDLTVKLSSTAASLYSGDTVQLTAKVVPMSYQNKVTWSSSDTNVAKVDENGLVTAVSVGNAVITATSVDKNASGVPATASCAVSVKDLVKVDASVNAQIVTSEGSKWVAINTADMSVSAKATATTTVTGAAAHGGKIYGTDSDFSSKGNIYMIDPANGFSETKGSECSASYAVLDGTTAPANTLAATDANGEAITVDTFGTPIYISNSQGLYMLLDYVEGSLTGWNGLSSIYNNLAAIAYAGETVYTDEDGTEHDAYAFFALCADGTLDVFNIMPEYDATAEDPLGYSLAIGTVGNIGIAFEEMTALSMTLSGDKLIIAYSNPDGAAELYGVDLSGETLSAGKIGNVPNATAISGLYTDAQMEGKLSVVATRAATNTVCSTPVSFRAPATSTQKAVDVNAASAAVNEVTGATNTTVEPASTGTNPADGTAVTVAVTAKDAEGKDIASTNGLISANYDASQLTLESVTVNAAYKAVKTGDGSLKIAYAGTETIEAGAPVAVLTFKVKTACDVKVSIITEQVNALMPGYVEKLDVSAAHANTELRGAKDANCVDAGYTGDLYCVDCGKLLKAGEEIPALGHKTELKNAKAPTSTEDGYTGDLVCTVCGEVIEKGKVIPATGKPVTDYTDVAKDAWYYDAVQFVTAKGLMNGMGDGIFAPELALTRAQMVTVLYRMAGSPEVDGKQTFTDVPADAYFAKAVIWAEKNGVTTGTSETTFTPDMPVTREQLVTFLWRFAKLSKLDVTTKGDLKAFPDADAVSAYAVEPMKWAVEQGIVNGMDGKLNPSGSATRAQIATIFMRYCALIEK